MTENKKLFAFKLADKQQKNNAQQDTQWKARDGVAVAGCSVFPGGSLHMYRHSRNGRHDSGNLC